MGPSELASFAGKLAPLEGTARGQLVLGIARGTSTERGTERGTSTERGSTERGTTEHE